MASSTMAGRASQALGEKHYKRKGDTVADRESEETFGGKGPADHTSIQKSQKSNSPRIFLILILIFLFVLFIVILFVHQLLLCVVP